MLARLTATRYDRPTTSGRTRPTFAAGTADDGTEIEVVLKCSAGCDRGVEALACEMLAACLAADLGLPVPEPFLFETAPEWITIVPDQEIRALLTRSSPLGFGSRRVGPGFATWSSGTRLGPASLPTAAAILAFDAFIQNVDRRSGNPNLLVRGDTLRLIDHELAFSHRMTIGWRPPWILGGLQSLAQPGACPAADRAAVAARLASGPRGVGRTCRRPLGGIPNGSALGVGGGAPARGRRVQPYRRPSEPYRRMPRRTATGADMTGEAYSYVVLRYVHDPVADESVNVGVLVHAPASRFLQARTRTTFGRLRKLFPDLDGEAFKRALRAVEDGVDGLAKEAASTPLLPLSDAASLARSVLPDDDSGLRWSRIGTGLTRDPVATLDALFLRFVARHDRASDRRRDDDDVWRSISQKLEAHDLVDRFEEKTIRGGADEITLRHAWKNGRWHAVEPVSLDLVDADGVKGKARRWLGHLSAVDGLAEQAIVHLVVGRPVDLELTPAYRDALAILRKAPATEVVEEDEADAVVSRLADEIMAHEAGRDDAEPALAAAVVTRN